MTQEHVIRVIKNVTDLLLLRKSFREAFKRKLKELKDADERAEKRMMETPSLSAR